MRPELVSAGGDTVMGLEHVTMRVTVPPPKESFGSKIKEHHEPPIISTRAMSCIGTPCLKRKVRVGPA